MIRTQDVVFTASARVGRRMRRAAISSSAKPLCRRVVQIGIEAIHLADAALVGEVMDHVDAIGVAFRLQAVEHMILHRALVGEAHAPLRLARRQHVVEDRAMPIRLRFSAGGRGILHDLRRHVAFAVPLEGAALEFRMQRVDQPLATGNVHARGNAALAEAGKHLGFLQALEALFRQPEDDVADLLVVHNGSRSGAAGGLAQSALSIAKVPARFQHLKRFRPQADRKVQPAAARCRVAAAHRKGGRIRAKTAKDCRSPHDARPWPHRSPG